MAENGPIVNQAKNITVPVFSHLWHVGRQLAVVLLYIMHQQSVFEAIWQELPSYLRPKAPPEVPKNAPFATITLLHFEAIPLRSDDPGRLTFRLSKYGR